jgi:hypothetical protein
VVAGSRHDEPKVFAMTRPTKSSFLCALISSTLGTVLVSVISVWLATSIHVSRYDAAPTHPKASSSHQLFQLSPIPPGADWTS